jgi:multidrug efflux pump subunit AcrB
MSGLNLSAWAVSNRPVVLFLLLLSLVAGAWSFLSMGRAEDPSFTIKTMVVSAAWPGATATEMRDQVADPIETAIRSLPHLDRVESYSRPGVAVVQVTLRDDTPGTLVADLWYEVRKKVGDIGPTLPDTLRGPFFDDEYSDVFAAIVMVRAPELPQAEVVSYAEALRDRLLRIPDIDKVELIGERPRRIFVDISYTRLATLGIPPTAIFAALSGRNDITPSGMIDTPTERIAVRVDGGLSAIASVADTPILAAGQTVRLGDIATVTEGYEDPPGFLMRYNGEDAIGLAARMRAGANGLALGAEIEATMQAFRATLPLGVDIDLATDQPKIIEYAFFEFLEKFVIAVGVVLLISFVTLGFSAGIIVALSVPLTLAITFVIMDASGMQFERITLGSLILALGLLVDDAIIAIEMMLVKMEEGMDRVTAATFAWTSTAFPMLTGTLVTVAGFLPVGFAASTAGEYAGGIFWVLLIALLVSWIVAVVFTPYLGVALLPRGLEARFAAKGAHDPYDRPFYNRFRALVRLIIRLRWPVIGSTVLAFAAAGIVFLSVPKQFFPTSERPELLIELRGPEGASIALSDREIRDVEDWLKTRNEVAHFSTYVGAGAPRFYLALNPVLPNENFAMVVAVARSIADRESLRTALQAHLGGIEGAVRARVLRLDFGPPTGHVVQFRVIGPDADVVQSIASDVRDAVRRHPDTRGVELQWGEQSKALRLEIDQDRARLLGVSSQEVSSWMQTFLSGAPVTMLRDGNRQVEVVLRADADERAAPEQLGDLIITTGSGATIPLSQIARIVPEADEPILWRRDGEAILAVRADLQDGAQGPDVTVALRPAIEQIASQLPPGYRITEGGAIEESAKANTALFAVLPVMFIIMLTLIVFQMRSISRTFLVFMTFPLGFIGASFALAVTGQPFGFVALLGILALGGIIVRNTLILADQIDTDMSHGLSMHDAIVETTVRRARPVVLTAFAAVLAFLPLTMTSFWGPMASVLIGGTLVGTVLTLFFLPALYAAWFRVRLTVPPADAGPDHVVTA